MLSWRIAAGESTQLFHRVSSSVEDANILEIESSFSLKYQHQQT
jgi:hypothetical protein